MPKTKYFDGVKAAQRDEKQRVHSTDNRFDLTKVAQTDLKSRLTGMLVNALLRPVYDLSRTFFPVFKAAGFYHVTRAEDVRAILRNPDVFSVPFGSEMEELIEGSTFALGMDGPAQARQNKLVRQVIKRHDTELITNLTRRYAEALLQNCNGSIDAVNNLFKRTVTEVCVRYFGLAVDDTDRFADWMIACSTYFFGDPYGSPEIRAQARLGAQHLRAYFDDAIMATKAARKKSGTANGDTLMDRLVTLQLDAPSDDPISNAEIRAILFGVMTGFVPTNTLASGKMLDELLRHPKAWDDAVTAARDGAAGAERLRGILLEAGRFNPAISPGLWRYCADGATIGGKRIEPGSTILASTMSAMRDPKELPNPARFWPGRVDRDGNAIGPDLMFGNGIHECVGKYLAIDQITTIFAALLSQRGIRRALGKAGRLQSLGPYPRNLVMEFDTPASQQSMFLVIAPVNNGATKAQVDATIASLGNPASAAIREALDGTGLLHFCSIATIESEEGVRIVFELSADGSVESTLQVLSKHADTILRPIFAYAGLRNSDSLQAFLNRHVVILQGKPWGANGLNYNGLAEFPVSSVAKQARFADFAGRVVRDYVATETARGSHPMLTMAHLRKILRQDPLLRAEATPTQTALMREAKEQDYDAYSLLSDEARLKLARYRPVSKGAALFNLFTGKDGRFIVWPIFALSLVLAVLFWSSAQGLFAWRILSTLAKALLGTFFVIAAAVGIFLFALRRAEKSDVPDTSQAPLSKLREIMTQENPPGYAQNHVLVIATMKPGWFRAFAHAVALWGIRVLITYEFRPGFVINMGTIHYARWWRVPGTKKVAFYSNFDGSWESYLEDFITRANQGQTAAWSNWLGFPKTRFLVMDGAQNGDAFKRWMRMQQQIVPFWYSRFPELTSDQIRNNALIHQGVGLARSQTECEEWIRCFGSMPRVENRIETDEVQALVFRGMKRLPYSVCLAITLPKSDQALGEWLNWVRGKAMAVDGDNSTDFARQIGELVKEGIILPVPRPADRRPEYALAHALSIAFGDRPLAGGQMGLEAGSTQAIQSPEYDPTGLAHADATEAMAHAAFLALSAAGIARFHAPNSSKNELLEGFPPSFRMGMAGRSRVTGDVGPDAPGDWRWNDDPLRDDTAEAVLMLYAVTPEKLERMIDIHGALLSNHGGATLSKTDCAPAWDDPAKADFEHFGYRDGISQPVIKGTSHATRGVPARDVVEPGEFILGYKNGQGFFPPSPKLRPEADMRGALPVAIDGNLSRFPDFGDASLADALRDLGRNGSFLVLRELRQDVIGFENFLAEAEQDLNSGGFCELYKLAGQFPDKEWIKAKLMGRWPNGRPVIGNPVNKPISANGNIDEIENDFSYGEDDPQGLACPLGAHIRRTNPRDSKQPGDKAEQVITNRHRLLRRGRTYVRKDTGEKGLLFASLCTDIERQFEFVQQFWANAPAFHGLDNEPDPFIGACPVSATSGQPKERVFTIPTVAGPVQLRGLKAFTQVMGGGYFFLPSRSALGWFTEAALNGQGSAL